MPAPALRPGAAAPPTFIPRVYEFNVLGKIARGEVRKAALCWHRKSGKDFACFYLACSLAQKEVGNYAYIFPTFKQAKRALWTAITNEGHRLLEYVPPHWRAEGHWRNETDMMLSFRNGSTLQFFGGEDPEALRGPNFKGVVSSEFAATNPATRDVYRPMLVSNGGWEIVNSTPLGQNHWKRVYEMAAAAQGEWFAETLSVLDTFDERGQRIITDAALDNERAEGIDEEMIQQEYFCSFAGVQVGSYYGRLMQAAEDDGRIVDLPILPNVPVQTFWDIGIRDTTAIWFVQTAGDWYHVIDYLEASGAGIPWYANALKEKQYVYQDHNWPHDGANREWGSGNTRYEIAEGLGIKPIRIAGRDFPRLGDTRDKEIAEGINAVRQVVPRCKFDRKRTQRGRDALVSYHREKDEKRNVFHDRPYHDWSSNGADSFRTFACAAQPLAPPSRIITPRSTIVLSNGEFSWMG